MSVRAILLTCGMLLLIACGGKGSASRDAGADMKPLPAQCMNGLKDGDESDVDCGGPTCNGCDTGGACLRGTDCASQSCVNNACATPSCSDEVKNSDETDVDCGGSCSGCASGKACIKGTDCASDLCTNGKCGTAAPSCSNGNKDGDETDVDCGGSCPGCASRKACVANEDCKSGKCEQGKCIAMISFGNPNLYRSSRAATSLVVSDFDNDGLMDVATCNDGTNSAIFYGDSSQGFGIDTTTTPSCPNGNIFASDVNLDDNMDIISNSIVVLLGNGDRTFDSQTLSVGNNRISLSDFNHDGLDDILMGPISGKGDLQISFGGAPSPTNFSSPLTIAYTVAANYFAANDLDGDGIIDIVTGNSDESQGSIIWGISSTSFAAPIEFSVSQNIHQILLSDLNSDGLGDIIVGTATPSISVRLTGPGRTIGSNREWPLPFTPTSLAPADLDGDGHDEIIVGCNTASQGGAVVIFHNENGKLTHLTTLSNINYFRAATGDINHDGKPDIVIGSNPTNPAEGGIYVLTNTTK